LRYKLITIDIDDTLLRNDLSISERNIKAIQAAVHKGVKVTLASGRTTQAVAPILDRLGLNLPVITYQGARIVDVKNGTVIYEKELEYHQALPIIRFAEERNIHCNLYVDDVVYIEKMNQWVQLYKDRIGTVTIREVGKLSNFLEGKTTKVIYIDESDRILNIKSQIEKIVDDDVNVFISKPEYLEFTNKHATKGCAVEFLGKYFGIKRKEIISIGDTYNDISMIEYAGLGVCMSNGPKEVQDIADYVTLSNEEDGVAHVIEKFVL